MSDFFKEQIVQSISTAIGKEVDIELIEIPPDPKMGDYAFPCFSLSKKLKKNPVEIAKDISKKIKSGKYISEIKPLGPYVNFFIKKESLAERTLNDIDKEKEKYGKKKIEKKTILLEGWQPNTHKAFHIGHIRNAILSESIARILEFRDHKVIRTSYMGDVGAHVAKWLWYYKKFYKGKIPKKNVSKWAGEIYSKASRKSHDNDKYKEEINEIHRKLEEGDPDLTKLWKKTRELCLEDMWKIFKEMDCKIERNYFESEVEKPGKEKVMKLVKKGLAEHSEGAIIINLEKYNLGIYVLLKSNGASLYSTKDIGLAYLKSKEYDFDLSLYVVASEQDHHFRQLFKTLELMGYKHGDKLKHVSYGLVKLKEGKMSSRLGNVILYEDFRDQLIKRVSKIIKTRKLVKAEKENIGKTVAFGAMNFTMLNQDSQKEIIFDPDQALSFEGETGPYVQYTHARASSILRKYKKHIKKIDYSLLKTEEERTILNLLYQFPTAVEKASMHYKPNIITRYLLDLSQAFNEYYHKHQILQEDKELVKARIFLVKGIVQVLKNGLHMLVIKAPEVM